MSFPPLNLKITIFLWTLNNKLFYQNPVAEVFEHPKLSVLFATVPGHTESQMLVPMPLSYSSPALIPCLPMRMVLLNKASTNIDLKSIFSLELVLLRSNHNHMRKPHVPLNIPMHLEKFSHTAVTA